MDRPVNMVCSHTKISLASRVTPRETKAVMRLAAVPGDREQQKSCLN